MRLAILATVATLTLAGQARAEDVPAFDLFQKICLQNPRDPAGAEAAARALGFVDSGRPTRTDKAKGINIVDLTQVINGQRVVVGVDDEPAEEGRGILENKCGVSVAGVHPDSAEALRAWAGFEPDTLPSGIQLYAYGSPDPAGADWERFENPDDARFGAAILAGNQRSLMYMTLGGGTTLLEVGYRKAAP